MLCANVVGAGLLIVRLAELTGENAWVVAAAVGGAGLSALGYEMWILGYLHAWNQISVCVSAVLMMTVIVLRSRTQLRNLNAATKNLFNNKYNFESAYLTFAAIFTLLAAMISCFRPPTNADETAY